MNICSFGLEFRDAVTIMINILSCSLKTLYPGVGKTQKAALQEQGKAVWND